MTQSDIEKFLKKHPPWFMFDFHPIRFAKKTSEEEGEEREEKKTKDGSTRRR